MKKIILLISLFGILLNLSAQNFAHVTVWKAEARSGGTYIGIAEDKFDAENVIEEIDFENQGTKYAIVGKEIGQIKINLYDAVSAKEDFVSDHSELEYRYITEIEMISLEYVQDDNLKMAIQFYKNASSVKSESLIREHLKALHENYSKYVFYENESLLLVGYSE